MIVKITDKIRLDWLMENGEEFMRSLCGANCCFEWLYPNRIDIDMKIRQFAAIKAKKKAAAKGD